MKLRQSFTDFIFSTNTDGSGKAASYVRALDMLGPILMRYYPHPIINGTMWQRFSLADIQAIHKWICAETKKGVASPETAESASPSYWMKNFCPVTALRVCHISPWAVDDYAKESLDQTGYGCEDPILLRNWLSTDLYEREVKAPANFAYRVRISSSMCEIPGSADHTRLLKVGDMSFKSQKKASEQTMNYADRHNIEATC